MKTIIVLLLLCFSVLLNCAAVFAATVFGSSDNPAPLSDIVPALGLCSGYDINLRTQPNTQSEVLTTLNKNHRLYLCEKIRTTAADKGWYRVALFTDNDRKVLIPSAFIYAEYVRDEAGNMSSTQRFRAAFETSVLFNYRTLQQATNSKAIPEELPKVAGYETHRTEFIPGMVAHSEKISEDEYVMHTIRVETSYYTVCGLRVGDTLTPELESLIHSGMVAMGWEGSKQAAYSSWMLYQANAGWKDPRPIRSFKIMHENNIITGFQWQVYLID